MRTSGQDIGAFVFFESPALLAGPTANIGAGAERAAAGPIRPLRYTDKPLIRVDSGTQHGDPEDQTTAIPATQNRGERLRRGHAEP